MVLIINGFSESGRVLARLLSGHGADIAVTGSSPAPDLTLKMRQDVEENGRRFLMLTPDSTDESPEQFSRHAIEKILNYFGHLDAFISYSGDEPDKKATRLREQNGRQPQSLVFDEQGLTKAALKQIITQ